jgi:hypothetical protein
MRINDPENFTGRVNYAALVIANRRGTTRTFDGCFENNDGDAVCAALVRRAQKNPALRENLPRYINGESIEKARDTLASGVNLSEMARKMRAKGKRDFEIRMAELRRGAA